jgi:hypothetical protein
MRERALRSAPPHIVGGLVTPGGLEPPTNSLEGRCVARVRIWPLVRFSASAGRYATGAVAAARRHCRDTPVASPVLAPPLLNRQPHRFSTTASFLFNPPFDQSLFSFLRSCHEYLIELMLDPRIDPFGLSAQKPKDERSPDKQRNCDP